METRREVQIDGKGREIEIRVARDTDLPTSPPTDLPYLHTRSIYRFASHAGSPEVAARSACRLWSRPPTSALGLGVGLD